MNKIILPAFALLSVAGAASADVTVIFPKEASGEYQVESQLISEMVKPRSGRKPSVELPVTVKDGKVSFATLPDGASQSVLYTSEREGIVVYALPGDNLVVEVSSVEPLVYTVKGTPLMETISALDEKGNVIKNKYFAIARSSEPDQEKLDSLSTSYDILFSDFIKQNPSDPAAVYALLQLDGQDYLDMLNVLPQSASTSPLYPLALNKKERVESNIAAEKRLEALQSGNVEAPAFTLKNLDGKDVSLSDFRGKWVILDFWGAWCPWCIKGFPSLKEAYKQYEGKLEIIGIDCRDSDEAWRAAVKRYELPWVQVYNGGAEAEKLYEEYAVQGFPTKVIVSPEGKIANITVGEDPMFFIELAKLIGAK